jgi:hypothetical protein
LLGNRRHLLVVGSQCEAMPDLPTLGDRTRRLHEVLRDPQLGGCLPALPDGRSLLVEVDNDPLRHTALNEAIDQAIGHAADRQATLVLALLGHGFKPGDDPNLYFMAWDTIEGSRRSAVNVTARLTEAVDEPGIDGVIALVDTCFAATAPPAGVSLVSGTRQGRTRLAVLMAAAANQPAYDLRFSDAVSDILRAGIRDRSEQLELPVVKQVVDDRLPDQPATLFLYDGIRALQGTGLGLWLAHNRQQVDAWDGTLDVEWVRELTANYCSTPAERRLRHALDTHRWVQLTGPPGGGKSTLMAALTRTDLLGAANTAHAMVFCDLRHIVADLAAIISDQLAVRLPRLQATQFIQLRQQTRAAAASNPAADAWDVEVITPLAALDRARALIGIDGVDQLDPPVRHQVYSAVSSLLARTGPQVQVVVSGRPDSSPEPAFRPATAPDARQESREEVHTATLDAAMIQDWLDARDTPPDIRAALATRPLADKYSWLLLRLLLDLADDGVAVQDLPAALSACYELFTDRAHAELPDDPYATVLPAFEGVLAAAGSTPIPLEVVHAALQAGGQGIDVPALRDLMVRLRHAVTRTHPGTASETVRPVHTTYAEYLNERVGDEQLRNAHQWVLVALSKHDTDGDDTDAAGYALAATPAHALGAGQLNLLRPAIARLHDHRKLFAVDRRRDWAHWLQRCEASGVAKGDPGLYDIRHELATWAGQSGDVAAALGLSRELMADQQRVLGPDHPDTLATRSNIAHWTGETGDARDAVRLFGGLLPDQERLLGADHPDTLTTRNNIASSTGKAGDARRALQLFEELLPDQERLLGADHRDTLRTRNNIAGWTGETGDARDAVRLFGGLLPDQERLLGADHPDTLTTRSNIASSTGLAGDGQQALQLFEELLPDQERLLGADRPETLTTRSNIAHWTGLAGDARRALQLFEELLPDQERVLGPDRPETLTTRNNIAAFTGLAGDGRRALQLFEELLPDRERVLGPDHPDTLTTRNNLERLSERLKE